MPKVKARVQAAALAQPLDQMRLEPEQGQALEVDKQILVRINQTPLDKVKVQVLVQEAQSDRMLLE